jgi:hypothetical protein
VSQRKRSMSYRSLAEINFISVDQSLASSETVTATDDSFEAEIQADNSEFETDWEEDGDGRDKIYHEIRSSYKMGCYSNSCVKQRIIERLNNDPHKQKLIDDTMREFYANFSKLSTKYRSCAGNYGSPAEYTAQVAQASDHGSSVQATSIKHRPDGSEEIPEDDEGDHPPKRPKLLHKPSDHTQPSPKFACPYHQHNPRKYGVNLQSSDADYRSCAGPGWRSVARIK